MGLATLAFGVLLLGVAAAELRRRRHPRLLAAALLAGMVCELGGGQVGARGGHIDLAPVIYLQTHMGLSRMASFGTLGWNFNLPYRIASITYSSLPAPLLMEDEVRHHLVTFNANDFNLDDPAGYNNIPYIILPRLAEDGVRYVVSPASAQWRQIRDAAVLPPDTALGQVQLHGLDQFSFIISYNAPQRIKGISLRVSLPPGQTQNFSVLVCVNPPRQCVDGAAKLTGSAAESWLEFDFPKSLVLDDDYHSMAIALKHEGGAPASIWTGKGPFGYTAPDMRLLAATPANLGTEVFNDGVAAIYELPNVAAYAKASDPRCALQILSRTHMRMQCPVPAQLTRLEMFDPGWHASVNGVETSVAMVDGRFQTVRVPAGSADVIFDYQPPHLFLACMLAFSAALIWLSLVIAEITKSRGSNRLVKT
jgi:hypothetical protein